MTHNEASSAQPPSRAVLLWSGGKDAAVALQALRTDPNYTVDVLLTTIVEGADTVTTHGVSIDLIRAQAAALETPLRVMRVPPSPSNATYEEQLERALAPLLAEGITTAATGDLFLDDIRAYREDVLQRIGATPHFPVWDRDTADLAKHVLESGYQAVVASVDTTQLDGSFAGRPYDASFLADLPDAVDPCGENGAFHTFVADGPPFTRAVPVRVAGWHGTGRMRYAQLRANDA
jgi:uncharacterized protein (TIGR00290 family)